MDRKQLSSLIVFSSMALVALMAIICRGFVNYQGQAIQLLLVSSAIATVALLIGAGSNHLGWIRISRYCFAALATLALLSWATGFAFATLLVLPVVLSVGFPSLFEVAGWKLELNPLNETFSDVMAQETNSTENPNSTATEFIGEVATDSHLVANQKQMAKQTTRLAEQPLALEGELKDMDNGVPIEVDPWSTVQHQFSVDSTLVQNVTQWQQPDGSRSIVANVRCQFTAAKETCIVHLPIWPLLAGNPEVFCRVASGPAATIKTTDSRAHGLRLEVKLEQTPASYPVETIVEVVATSEASQAEQAA